MGGPAASKQSTHAAQFFKGTKLFGERKQNVTFIIVEHRVTGPEKCVPSIIEVVAYAHSQGKPEEVKEAPRLYLSLQKIFQKLKLPGADNAVSNSAENRSLTLDLVAKYIFGRVTVSEEPLSVGSDFKVELLPSYDDDEDSNTEASDDILHDGPIILAPLPYTEHVNDEFRADDALSKDAPESIFRPEIPSTRSMAATDAINAFLIMFARNRSLLEVGSSASRPRKLWVKAIRKVILKRDVHRTRATLRLRALRSSCSISRILSDTAMTIDGMSDSSGMRKKDRKERRERKDSKEKISTSSLLASLTKSKTPLLPMSSQHSPLFPAVEKINNMNMNMNMRIKDGTQDTKIVSTLLFPNRDSKNEKMDVIPSPPSSLPLSVPTASFKSHKRNIVLPDITTNTYTTTPTHNDEPVTSPKLSDRLNNKKHFSPSEVVIPEESSERSSEISSEHSSERSLEHSADLSSLEGKDPLDLREIRLCVRNSESVKKVTSITRKTRLVILEEENEDESETENEITRNRKEQFEALIMKSEKTPCYNTSDVEEAMLRLLSEFNAKGISRGGGNQREDIADDQDKDSMRERENNKDKTYMSKRKSLSAFEATKMIPRSLLSSLRGTSKSKPSKSEDFTLRQFDNPQTAGLMWEKIPVTTPTTAVIVTTVTATATATAAPTPPALPPLSSPRVRTPVASPSPAHTPRMHSERSSRQVSKRTISTSNSSHCATPITGHDTVYDSAAYQAFNDDLESSLKNTYDFVFSTERGDNSSRFGRNSGRRASTMASPSPPRSAHRLSITPLKTPTTPIPSPIMSPSSSVRISA